MASALKSKIVRVHRRNPRVLGGRLGEHALDGRGDLEGLRGEKRGDGAGLADAGLVVPEGADAAYEEDAGAAAVLHRGEHP